MRIDNPIGSNAALTGSFSGSFYGNGSGLSGVAASNVEYANVLNKPTLLSGSAQIASQISGSFTAVSASIATRFDNLGTGFATDSELASVSSSLASDITNIYSTYATDTELANVSSSIASDITGINNAISGLDNTYATDAQLAAVSSSLAQANNTTNAALTAVSASVVGDLIGFSQALQTTSGSFANRIDGINSTIGSLDSIYATDAALISVSSSFASTTSTNVQIARLNSGSFAGKIDALTTTINNLGNTYATDSELASVSSSFASRVTAGEGTLGTAVSTNTTQNNRLAALEAATGSYQAGLTFNDTTGQGGIDFTNTSGTITATTVGLSASATPQFAGLVLSGSLGMGGNKITNLDTPTSAKDAANKQYVDEVAQGVITRPSVRAATTTNLEANYSNGTLGVGATLTADTNRVFTALDGVTGWAVTTPRQSVLVKNQTNAAHNGRYILTALGEAGVSPWVLTRCSLCDEADEIPSSYTFVQLGTINGGTGWIQTVANPETFVVGTDAITVSQFSGAGTYIAGSGLDLNGTEFSVEPNLTLTSLSAAKVTATSITGSLAGNASTASKLATARTITLGGDLTGNVSFDGSAGVTLTATIAADSVALGADTTGNYVASLVAGTGISLANNSGEGATPTITNSAPDQVVALTAGSNVTITGTYPNFTIASTDTNTTYTASTGLSLTGTAFSIDSSVVTLSGAQTLTNKTIGGGQLVDASVTNAKLANSGVTVSAGTGMSGGGAVSLGGTITLTNAGVTSNVAGTGITVSGGTGAVTITNADRGSSQNIFKNFAVAGQSTVVADVNDDTLTLAAGSNVTITTNASTDTITIASTDTNTTYTAGAGLTLSSTEFSHSDTSSVTNLTTSSRRYVSALTFDTYGHVTGYETGTETVTDTNTTYSVGDGGLTAVNFTTTRRDKLDGIAAGATNVTNTNQLTNGAGYQTTSGTVAKVENTVSGTNSADLVYGNMADNDQFRIRIGGTATNSGFVEIATADDGTEPILVRQYTGVFGSLARTANLLDGSGNTTFPGDVTAYSSDERLKENVVNIPNALDKVLSLNGVTFDWKQEAFDAGFNPKIKEGDAGVLAQQVQAVLPQAVKPAPFDLDVDGNSISGKDYLTVQYEKLAPLFIEAIKEQQAQIELLKAEIVELKNK